MMCVLRRTTCGEAPLVFVLANGLGPPGVAVAPALAPVLPPWAASAREKPPGGGGDGAQGSCPHPLGRRVGSPSFQVHRTGRENPGTPRDTCRGPRGCRGGTRAAWVLFADVEGHGFRGRQNSVPKDTRALVSSWWTDKQTPQADPAQKRCRLGTAHLQSLTPAQRCLNLQGLAGNLRGAEVNTGLVSTRFESMPLVTLSH